MDAGRPLIVLGAVIMAVGLLLTLGSRIGLGRLPGDIHITGERGSFYFPVVTCILVSVVLSLLAALFNRR